MAGASSQLVRYLALVYGTLAIYASLYPFSGWRDTGAPPLDFLYAPWPRYYTAFDLAINVVGYVPLGFLLVPALYRPLGRWGAAVVALALGVLLSFSMELLQNFVPSRVPSNVDLACNSAGALLGVLCGIRWGRTFRDGGTLHALRATLFAAGKSTDAGLVLIGIWLLTQLNPEALLFGTGDLRSLLELEAPFPYTAERFQLMELCITAAGVVAVGLIACRLLQRPAPLPVIGLFLSALSIKALATAVIVDPDQFAHWITSGNLTGLACGAVLLAVGMVMPPVLQQVLATLSLLIATALVNLTPENPYAYASPHDWNHSHFLNFNGLTRLASGLWPFLAMAFLVAAGPSRESRETRQGGTLEP